MQDLRFPLTTLIERLRSAGIRVAVSQISDIQKILLLSPRLKLDDIPGIITPILATNPRDQKIIENTCSRYVNELRGLLPQITVSPNSREPGEPFSKVLRKKLLQLYKSLQKHKRIVYPVAIAILGLLLISYYFSPGSDEEDVVANRPLGIYYSPQQIIVGQEVSFAMGKNSTGQGAGITWHFNDTSAASLTDTIEGRYFALTDTITKKFDYASNQTVTLYLKDSTYNIVDETTTSLRILADINPDENFVIKTSVKLYILGGLILLLIASYFLLKYYYLKNQKAKTIKTNIQIDNQKYTSPPYQISFPDANYLLDKGTAARRIVNNLQQKEEIEAKELNIQSSLAATCKNAGFPTVKMKNKTRLRQFLVVIEAKEENDHLYRLFEWLTHTLSHSGIFLEEYTYHPTFDEVTSTKGRRLTLEKLLQEKPGYNLIIFGEGAGLLEDLRVKIRENYLPELGLIETKILITPVPIREWTLKQDLFSNVNFIVIPADTEAISLMAENITRGDSPAWKDKLEHLTPWTSPSSFNFESVSDLQEYLDDPRLFQLVCALAVYPRLEWPLTIRISDALAKFINKKNDTSSHIEIDYNVLLKLCRISWLRTGVLKDSLRTKLLDYLEPAIQAVVREHILEMLEIAKPYLPEDAIANVEMEVQSSINSFALYSYDPKRFAHLESSKNDIASQWYSIADWPFLQHIKESSSSLFNKSNTVTVEDYIFPNRKGLFRRNFGILAGIFVVGIILVLVPNTPLKKTLPEKLLEYKPPQPDYSTAKTDSTVTAPPDSANKAMDTSVVNPVDSSARMADSLKK